MNQLKLFRFIFIMCIIIVDLVYAKPKNQVNQRSRINPVNVELSDQAAVILGGKKIKLGDAIRIAIEQNHDIITGSYDVAMTDSAYQRYLNKYSPLINFEGGSKYQEFPEDMGPIVGRDEKSLDISAAIAKRFSTGTTVSTGIKHEYTKTTYEPIVIPGLGSIPAFGDPEYHRPILFISIQQELLKNAFGYNEHRRREL